MRPDEEEAGSCEPGTIICIDLKAMAAANLTWNGPPEDPIELASPCPVCGNEPDWKRTGYNRLRLECCEISGDSQQFRCALHHEDDRGTEMNAVISWNREAAWAKEGMELDRQEAEREAAFRKSDEWADRNLPAPA